VFCLYARYDYFGTCSSQYVYDDGGLHVLAPAKQRGSDTLVAATVVLTLNQRVADR
jgi:hypothetical protein